MSDVTNTENKKRQTKKEKLISRIEKFSTKIVENDFDENHPEFIKCVEKIESVGKHRISDFDEANTHFKDELIKLLKGNNRDIEHTTIKVIEMSQELISQTKLLRKKKNRRTSKINTNLLAGYPFSVGNGFKSLSKITDTGLEFTRQGIVPIYYQNAKGKMLNSRDFEVLSALYSLWEEQGNGEFLEFTFYKLRTKLNVDKGGKQYQLLRGSYEKLADTKVIFYKSENTEDGEKHDFNRYPLINGESLSIYKNNEGQILSEKTTLKISFHPDAYDSFRNGHYSLISLDLLLEIGSSTGKALYSLICALPNMEEKDLYIRKDGKLEFPLEKLYEQFTLKNSVEIKNKYVISGGCEELYSLEILKHFYFTFKEKQATTLVLELSEHTKDIFGYNTILNKNNQSEQITFFEENSF